MMMSYSARTTTAGKSRPRIFFSIQHASALAYQTKHFFALGLSMFLRLLHVHSIFLPAYLVIARERLKIPRHQNRPWKQQVCLYKNMQIEEEMTTQTYKRADFFLQKLFRLSTLSARMHSNFTSLIRCWGSTLPVLLAFHAKFNLDSDNISCNLIQFSAAGPTLFESSRCRHTRDNICCLFWFSLISAVIKLVHTRLSLKTEILDKRNQFALESNSTACKSDH